MSNLTQNVGILMRVSILTQLISFASYPVFTRLYDPNQFGTYGIVFTAVNFFMPLMGLKLDVAIIQENTIKGRSHLFRAIVTINLFISFLASLFVVIYLNGSVDLSDMYLFLLVFLLLYFFGFYQAHNQLLVSEQKYKDFSNVLMLEKVSITALKILFGLFYGNWIVLFISEIGAKISGIIYQRKVLSYRALIFDQRVINKFDWSRYKNYFTYDLFSDFLDTASNAVPILIFGLYYSKIDVGIFLFVYGLYKVGLKLWGKSISPVFFRTLELASEGDRIKIVETTVNIAVYVIIVTQGILLLIDRGSYVWLFGENWGALYDISFMVCLGLSPILLVKVVSNIFRVYRKQSYLAYLGGFNLILFSSSGFFSAINLEFDNALKVFVATSLIVYLVYIVVALGLVRVPWQSALHRLLRSELIVLVIIYASIDEDILTAWYMKIGLLLLVFYRMYSLVMEWKKMSLQ